MRPSKLGPPCAIVGPTRKYQLKAASAVIAIRESRNVRVGHAPAREPEHADDQEGVGEREPHVRQEGTGVPRTSRL